MEAMTETLADRIDGTIRELRHATSSYAQASREATQATLAYLRWEAQRETSLRVAEAAVTSIVCNDGIKRSAPERDTTILAILADDPALIELKAQGATVREEKERAACRLAIADQWQKSLRDQLRALTALVGTAA